MGSGHASSWVLLRLSFLQKYFSESTRYIPFTNYILTTLLVDLSKPEIGIGMKIMMMMPSLELETITLPDSLFLHLKDINKTKHDRQTGIVELDCFYEDCAEFLWKKKPLKLKRHSTIIRSKSES